MTPDPAAFDRAKAAFLSAVAAPTPADRAAAVDRHCGTDADLRQRVDALLAANDAAGSLPTVAPAPPADLPLIAGRYKLLEQIGVGGMGVVYMAEQRSPVRRPVAVKLIKQGMDSKAVIARFEAERQALAMMDHPNIARVLDGGVTADGRPFFVMELVKGLPVTDYCDVKRMIVRDRLALFTQICQAVQHAHQKGIIHRDIKPTNVLVTEHDGKPVPKVIDFGLAKALAGPSVLTDHTLHTGFGVIAGTPLYTAPEQVAINSIDVDTRADIYALGVLLYELLTGSPPLQKERLKAAAWDEIRRVIREEEPPRPSLRISTSLTLPALASSRQIDPGKLSGLVKGDLDWIVLKTLEKERNRRYDSATALAADIDRHLNDEAVLAAPPTAAYRTRKFVRKHRRPVIAAAAAAALLTGGLTATTWQWRRADANAVIATRNQQVAEAQRNEADRQRDAAETEAYVADLAFAVAALESGNYPDARRRLAACPMSRRGFEWNFLDQKAESAIAAFTDSNIGFSRTARLVVTQQDHVAHLWTLAGDQVGEPIPTDSLPTFSPDGRVLLGRTPDDVQLYDVAGHKVRGPIPFPAKLRYGTAVFSADASVFLTAPSVDTAQAWDQAGNRIGRPVRHLWDRCAPLVSPDGSLLVTTVDPSHVQLWTSAGEGIGGPILNVQSNREFSPDGHCLVCYPSPEMARLWDVAGRPLADPFRADGVQFSPAGDRILATDSVTHTTRICDPLGRPVNAAVDDFGPTLNANQKRFDTRGDVYATVPTRNVVQLRDRDGRPVGIPMTHGCAVKEFQFSPDGRTVFTLDANWVIHIWDRSGRPTGEPIRGAYREFHVTPDGRFVVAADGALFDRDGRPSGLRSANNVLGIADVDGDVIVTGTNGYSTPPFAEVLRVDHLDSPVQTITAPEAELLVQRAVPPLFGPGATSRTVRLDAGNRVVVSRPGAAAVALAHGHAVAAVVVSNDGSRVVTATDRFVRFWDPASGRELAAVAAAANVTGLTFTPDGSRLLVRLIDGSVESWDDRAPVDRQRERDAMFAESPAARAYVQRLLAGDTPSGDLSAAVLADPTLPPLRRAEAYKWAACRLDEIKCQAEELFADLSTDAYSQDDLSAHLAATDCPPRLRESTRALILKREFSDGLKRDTAFEVLTTPGNTARQYTRAAQVMESLFDRQPTGEDDLRRLGIARFRVGRYAQAIEELKRSAEVLWAEERRVDRATYAVLAMAYCRLGQPVVAQSMLARMQDDPTNVGQGEARLRAEADAMVGSNVTPPTTAGTTRPGGD